MLGCVELDEETWRVGRFAEQANRAIAEIRSRGNLPILVGGTHYYSQALLFKDAVVENGVDEYIPPEEEEKTWPILGASTDDMLQRLQEVDPSMAVRWHPKDRRKIRRSLEIWLKTGRKASDIYEEQTQRRAAGSVDLGQSRGADDGQGKNTANNIFPTTSTLLRFPTLILWVHASSDILMARLNERVEDMMNNGLLSEVELMQASLRKQEAQGCTVDETRGIWVAIGYKEFAGYISALNAGSMGPKELESMKQEAIERTKIATRQYARRQVRWIRLKLLRTLRENQLANTMYLLESSDLSQWSTAVENMACDLIASFLAGTHLPEPPQLSGTAREMLSPGNADTAPRGRDFHAMHCDICTTTLMTEEEWVRHLKSRKHKKAAKAKGGSEARGGNSPTEV